MAMYNSTGFLACQTYDIINHDAAFATRNYLEVGVDTDEKGIAESVDRCAIIHITRVQDLQAA